jgi:shikimate dehydrogenase
MNFYGLFGERLSHSLSPEIHKEIYERVNIQAAYKTFSFPPSQLQEAVCALRTLSIKGVNVTIPYKEAVLPFLDEIDSHAQKLEAVNTILQKNGKLIGYNTDYDGFGLIFSRRNWSVEGKTATVLGSGGAAKMAIHYLEAHGASHIHVISRSPDRFENTERKTYTNYKELMELSGNFLINTTPVGMFPHVENTPASEEVIQAYDCLIDLIYNPYETLFLTLGKAWKKETANGMDMLIGQAIRSVEIWEEKKIDLSVTQDLIEQFTQRQDDTL